MFKKILQLLLKILFSTLLLADFAIAEPDIPMIDETGKSLDTEATDIKGMEQAKQNENGVWVVDKEVSGTGTVDADHIQFNGVVSPGNSPGCLQSTGNLTFGNNSTLRAEIGGLMPCTEHDQFDAGLTMTIAGASLEVILIDNYVPSAGDTFYVLVFGNLSGSGFSTIDLSQAVLPSPLEWDTSQLMVTGELIVFDPTPPVSVPVPMWTLILFAALLIYLKPPSLAANRDPGY